MHSEVIFSRNMLNGDGPHHVTFLDAYVLDNGRGFVLLGLCDAGAAFPLPRLELIVHLDHVLLGCADNASAVKHHAGDGVIVGICIKDGPCP